ncbi:MAG: hypothetical protein JXA20_01315 [Spirochaetes bacterium]|nr:hypothetical protein [Spirochaetota bacterium]
MKKLFPIAVLLLLAPLYADWDDYGLTLVSTTPSTMEEATRFEVKDRQDHTFFVNARNQPEGAAMRRILRYKDDILGWHHASFRELSFYIYEKGIHAVCVPYAATYRKTNLMNHLPSGFLFFEEREGLNFRFRIVVGSTSLKLDGVYKGEEPLLEEVYRYIKGIREGKIQVEDERVVSGSVVSFPEEKDKGDKRIYPTGDFPDIEKAQQEAREKEEREREMGKPAFYASAQAAYLLPVNILSDIFIGGYGFLASGGLRDIGISLQDKTIFKLEMELSTGYWHLSDREQQGISTGCSMNTAYIVPILFTARGRFGLFRELSVAPAVSFGYNFNRLNYTKTTLTGIPYCMSVRQWNPSFLLGLRFDYRFERFFLFAGTDFMAMFERRMTITSLLFNTGGGYRF